MSTPDVLRCSGSVYGITMGADSASQVMGLRLEGEKLKGANTAVAESVTAALK